MHECNSSRAVAGLFPHPHLSARQALLWELPGTGVTMKAKIILLAIAAAAVAVGFALPTPDAEPEGVSQIATLELGG